MGCIGRGSSGGYEYGLVERSRTTTSDAGAKEESGSGAKLSGRDERVGVLSPNPFLPFPSLPSWRPPFPSPLFSFFYSFFLFHFSFSFSLFSGIRRPGFLFPFPFLFEEEDFFAHCGGVVLAKKKKKKRVRKRVRGRETKQNPGSERNVPTGSYFSMLMGRDVRGRENW